MGKILSILLLGLILFTTISLNLSEVTRGDDPIIVGRIYGMTYENIGWGIRPVPFTYIKTGNIQNISNLYGDYELNGLSLNHVYEITAKKMGYKDTIISIELTEAEPELELNIELILRDSVKKSGQGHMH